MGSPKSSMSRRRIRAVVASVVAVAAVVTGASALARGGSEPDASPRTSSPAAQEDPTVDLDLGPVDDADVTACLGGGFAPDAGSVEVLYGVRQRSADGSAPVLLLRNASGELRLCDVAGPDSPAQLPLPEATAAEPVAFLTNGRKAWDCDGSTVDGYTSTTWLAVGPTVATVQERFWVDGVPGSWFSTEAQGGYAHLQTWLAGPLPEGTELGVQLRVLDADGKPVAQSALPTGTQSLPGCTEGDVQIG